MTSYSQKYPTDYEQIVNEAQIENGNIASEIHGFTIVYGKFTLITISTAIRKKKNKNFSRPVFMQLSTLIVIIILIRAVFLRI